MWVGLVVAAFVGVGSLVTTVVLITGSKPSINPAQSIANTELQAALDRAIDSDNRNSGIDAMAYYSGAFDRSVVVFDLRDVTETKSRADVFRLLLDFAHEVKDRGFDSVELSFRGDIRFRIDGYYFRSLGRDRHLENPMYMIRTFPEHLETPAGLRAYPEWTGEALGVLSKQMEDFNDFHDRWYLNELMCR